jgi:transcriptional regulator with XRE-family HTH domain
METKHRWEQPLSERIDVDVDVIVESSLAMAQATIQKAMKEGNVRNADLAERLGRPRSFISKMLSGSHNLTVKTLARALAVCGYELTWQYQSIQWGWVKEPVVIHSVEEIETGAAPAALVSTAWNTCLAYPA